MLVNYDGKHYQYQYQNSYQPTLIILYSYCLGRFTINSVGHWLADYILLRLTIIARTSQYDKT
jgi:hypothetical protein